jgi:tRNA(Ile)-lysidine synthase
MSHKNLSVKIKIPKFFRDKLKDKKINLIYKRFEKSLNINENFGVAVSGGPDSLALAFLAKTYSLKRKINPKFFIVDHKLRQESTKEAKAIQKILKRASINLEILTWKGKKPKKNIQSIARKIRYKLMSDRCEKYEIQSMLVGHHQDDLIENFFIRMVRGSGLKGLVSLDKKSKIDNTNIYRPLIDQKKDDLILVSKKIFDFYVRDPSNNDEKFQRIRIRKLIEELRKDGLDMNKFLKTIKNLKYSNNVINFYVDENLKQNTFFSNKDKRLILNRSFFLKSYEVVFRGLSDSLKKIGGKYYSVRGKKLEKMIYDIQNNRLFRSTLGGCIVEKVNHTIIISKEG